MGDLVVITHDACVAKWAAETAYVTGTNETLLHLAPVMVLLTLAETDRLREEGRGELAMFAAWAVHDQRGREARRVVREVVGAIDAMADVALRDTLAHAMISMLGEPLLAVIREMLMQTVMISESPGFKSIREDLEVRGEAIAAAHALLRVLQTRGLFVDDASREHIERCEDTARLTRWIKRAVKAAEPG